MGFNIILGTCGASYANDKVTQDFPTWAIRLSRCRRIYRGETCIYECRREKL